jgi:hypothetical protein
VQPVGFTAREHREGEAAVAEQARRQRQENRDDNRER